MSSGPGQRTSLRLCSSTLPAISCQTSAGSPRLGFDENFEASGKEKVELRKPRRKMTKKEPTRNCVRASSVAFVFYANLVAIVMMVVAVNPMPVPVVRGARGIAIVSIRSVVSIRVIAIVIAVPIGRITKSDSHAPNSH